MITLYEFDISPFCDKVRRILNLKRTPYRRREVKIAEVGRLKKTVSPTGKYPALEIAGRRIVDSTDIALEIEALFPDPAIYPADPRRRALAHMIEDWADESLYFYEMTMRFTWPENAKRFIPSLLKAEGAFLKAVGPRLVPGALGRIVKAQGVGRKTKGQILAEVERHTEAVSAWLGEDAWLAGGALSIADIAVFVQLACIRQTPEGAAIIGRFPAVEDWMARTDKATGDSTAVE